MFRALSETLSRVGSIGAGASLHHATNGKVHGLTTAASIWVTAALGVLCGLTVAIAGVLFCCWLAARFGRGLTNRLPALLHQKWRG
jgi:putative Mg2+ transporter-C (MgtC) family protein